MAKKRAKAPAKEPPRDDPHPSAALLAELEELRRQRDKERRCLRAWQIVLEARPKSDFAVILDFALEHGLVLALSAEPRKRRGERLASLAWVNPIDGSEMVWIPPGPFVVGPDRTRAESAGFSLGRYPVTNAQFKRFLDETGYVPPPEHPAPQVFLSHWEKSGPPKGAKDHPVVWVSFLDALAYCKWAGMALPSEWLWEKVARGPDGRSYPWGNEFPRPTTGPNKGKPLTNVDSDGTCAVGKYPRTRTPYGCEDMVGNVSEWCQMTDEKNPGRIPDAWPDTTIDTTGPIQYAAVRGSCFLRVDRARMVSWHRRRLSTTRRNQWVGFRPAFFQAWRPAEE
jgi:serine/threonine-protein kinase